MAATELAEQAAVEASARMFVAGFAAAEAAAADVAAVPASAPGCQSMPDCTLEASEAQDWSGHLRQSILDAVLIG